VWSAAEVKAKRDFVLPLAGRPLAIIVERHGARRLHWRYVFHGPRCRPGHVPSKRYGCIGDFKRAWTTACKKAGFAVGRASRGMRGERLTSDVPLTLPGYGIYSLLGGPTLFSTSLAGNFCVPATGTPLIDNSVDLPGPGSVSVTGVVSVCLLGLLCL
jgi:hypothetical protein